MAAIAGCMGKGNPSDCVTGMLETLRHRGPDTRKLESGRAGAFGVGAASISPERGDGFASDGDVLLFFDGEIHNERGSGESDAETALRIYRDRGRCFAAHLHGVFACAVLDGDELVLARDSVGVRPLYWGTANGNTLCFASEMKALAGLANNVQELLPGTTFSSQSGVAGYLPQTPAVAVPRHSAEAIGLVRDTLLKAVERRLADGGAGACLLSGGLDSSIIAAAVKALGAKMPLLTVGFEGGSSDVENAKIMAEHLGFEHRIAEFSQADIEAIVPQAVRTMESFDEDCVSGTIANLFASKLAREHSMCILSGEGGDELFGGYHLLKDLPSDSARQRMMQRLVDIAYNTAVQRLDRSMMAHSIHYRTPFIDTEVMALAAHVPVPWKIRDVGNGKLVEKWILREAFKDLLPEPIYRRDKLRFSGGTGVDGIMDRIAEKKLEPNAFNEQSRRTPGGYTLNSPKELWYYRLFKDNFPDDSFEQLVGRWDPGK